MDGNDEILSWKRVVLGVMSWIEVIYLSLWKRSFVNIWLRKFRRRF